MYQIRLLLCSAILMLCPLPVSAATDEIFIIDATVSQRGGEFSKDRQLTASYQITGFPKALHQIIAVSSHSAVRPFIVDNYQIILSKSMIAAARPAALQAYNTSKNGGNNPDSPEEAMKLVTNDVVIVLKAGAIELGQITLKYLQEISAANGWSKTFMNDTIKDSGALSDPSIAAAVTIKIHRVVPGS